MDFLKCQVVKEIKVALKLLKLKTTEKGPYFIRISIYIYQFNRLVFCIFQFKKERDGTYKSIFDSTTRNIYIYIF